MFKIYVSATECDTNILNFQEHQHKHLYIALYNEVIFPQSKQKIIYWEFP